MAESPIAREKRVVSTVMWRLIPFLFLCYMMNYIDRVNVGYAALEMRVDLGFSATVFGLGAGMFFVGYVFFEVPSNLILEAVGARWWIARIMVSWGLLTACMVFVHTATGFYVLRCLLGFAEAGFFPGIIYYLTFWIPARDRARASAWFLTSTSLSGVIGGPLAGWIMGLKGTLGLAGWQWLFLLEGLPAALLGLVVLRRLDDRVEDAAWLPGADRTWLRARIAREHATVRGEHAAGLLAALTSGRVWHLCLTYFALIISYYGVVFWLPQILKSFGGLTNAQASVLTALPYLAATVSIVAIGHHSDAVGERRWHVAVPAAAGACGLLAAGVFQQAHPWLALAALCVAAGGIWGTLGPFWSLPGTFLTGTAAAGGIALINSVGNAGGFVGPVIVGKICDRTGSYQAGLWTLAVTLLAGSALSLGVRKEARRASPR
ncbi:MAG: MFS transporter [Candidatus Coatesbacteria bacterium]